MPGWGRANLDKLGMYESRTFSGVSRTKHLLIVEETILKKQVYDVAC